MFIFSPAENLCSRLSYMVHSPLVTQLKTATVSKSFLGLAAMVQQSSYLHDAWDWLAFTHGTKNQPWCAWYTRRLLQMISHRFNIVSKTVAVEDNTLTPVHGLPWWTTPIKAIWTTFSTQNNGRSMDDVRSEWHLDRTKAPLISHVDRSNRLLFLNKQPNPHQ